MADASPWFTMDAGATYASGHSATSTGQRRIGRRLLTREAREGRLRAVQIGGRKQLLTRAEWIDAWMLESSHADPDRDAAAHGLEKRNRRTVDQTGGGIDEGHGDEGRAHDITVTDRRLSRQLFRG